MTRLYKQFPSGQPATLRTMIEQDVQSEQPNVNEPDYTGMLLRRLDRLMHTVSQMAETLPPESQDALAQKFGGKFSHDTTPLPSKPKVVVILAGGNVQSIHSSIPDIQVKVVDHDNLTAEGKSEQQANAIQFNELQNCPFEIKF